MPFDLVFDPVAFHVHRIRAGYRSVSAVARAVGVTPGYCGMVARGLVPPPELRAKIAAALKVSEATLWAPVGDLRRSTKGVPE
jgi:hypothetical protein